MPAQRRAGVAAWSAPAGSRRTGGDYRTSPSLAPSAIGVPVANSIKKWEGTVPRRGVTRATISERRSPWPHDATFPHRPAIGVPWHDHAVDASMAGGEAVIGEQRSPRLPRRATVMGMSQTGQLSHRPTRAPTPR
jgi:hypothetical protein